LVLQGRGRGEGEKKSLCRDPLKEGERPTGRREEGKTRGEKGTKKPFLSIPQGAGPLARCPGRRKTAKGRRGMFPFFPQKKERKEKGGATAQERREERRENGKERTPLFPTVGRSPKRGGGRKKERISWYEREGGGERNKKLGLNSIPHPPLLLI